MDSSIEGKHGGSVPLGCWLCGSMMFSTPTPARPRCRRRRPCRARADGLPVEQVAALEPYLIVATTHVEYDKDRSRLERITKVIDPTTTAHDETWRQSTIRVGTAVGMGNEAAQLVRGIKAKLTTVRQEHPEWAGKTYTNGPVLGPGEVWTISSTTDVSATLLGELGLVLSLPREQSTLPPAPRGQARRLRPPRPRRRDRHRLSVGPQHPVRPRSDHEQNHTGAEHGVSLTRLFDADKEHT